MHCLIGMKLKKNHLMKTFISKKKTNSIGDFASNKFYKTQKFQTKVLKEIFHKNINVLK